LKDPHADKKVKPPMYFKGHEIRKGYTEFDKRDTLNQMPGSSMANEVEETNGNKFFEEIQ